MLVTGEVVARQPMHDEDDLAWEAATGIRYQYSPRVAVDAGIGTVICISEGLPAHEMLRVYNYMGLGLVVTGLVAWFTSQWAMSSPANAELLYGSPLAWVIMLSPLSFECPSPDTQTKFFPLPGWNT